VEYVPIFVGDRPRARIVFGNAGNTPAYGLQLRFGMWFGTSLTREILERKEVKLSINSFVLEPKSSFTYHAKFLAPFAWGDSVAILRGSMIWFAFGDLAYTDSFHQAHHARFCWRYSPQDISFVVHDLFNEVD
jgi:hypothetical protein